MNCAFGPSVLRKDETVLLVSSAKKWLVFDDFQYRGSNKLLGLFVLHIERYKIEAKTEK